MPKKEKEIHVNAILDDSDIGITVEKLSMQDLPSSDNITADIFEEGKQSHRHDCHSFYLLQSGTVSVEIDFKKYKIKPLSIIYVHPNQVHRTTTFKNVTVYSWGLNNENLNPEYLTLLEDITPAKPLVLRKDTFAILSEAVSLCIKFFERKGDRLYHSLLKDSCNALVALVISQYLSQAKPADKLSRFEAVTKAFAKALEDNYVTVKRPSDYARLLNVSTPYLNECVKNITGYPVSYHIQQRVVLEAKRLLYHTSKSVKEIASELGYDDYPYFSRLFTKVTGMTALSFRTKNRD